jgi:hypothetical protein
MTTTRRVQAVIVGAFLIALSTACANVPPSEAEAGSPTVDPHGPEPDWDNLLVGALEVPGVTQAVSYLSFRPTLPALGPPDKVYVGGGDRPTKSTTVGMRFTTEAYGRFWLLEQESQTNQEELEALASSCDPEKGCEGSWTLTKLDDGTVALSIAGPKATSIVWLRGEVRFDVLGPSATFTTASAAAVANGVVTA